MENSISSSPNKVIATSELSIEADSATEESGWTQYIDYFEACNNQGRRDNHGDDHYTGCSSEMSPSSSPNKVIGTSGPSIEADSATEESGWTQYIDYFEACNKKADNHGAEPSGSYSEMGASMVSDAGSGPEWKTKGLNKGLYALPKQPKRLNFTRKIPFDDSLEDTASSPVNSPKITSFFNRMNINSRKMESDDGSPLGNEISIDKHKECNDINREHDFDIENIELKQRGLCIVPIPMVVDYLG